MCILISKPRGIKTPEKEVLKKCWDNNPDGAGFAWSDGRKLFLKKGFMKWEDFEKEFDSVDLDPFDAILHFRIATHGTVKPENTHPFNVNDGCIAAHNGVLRIKNEGDWTDSETFFKRICAPILETHELSSETFEKAITATIDTSKLAFLTDDSEMVRFGNFSEDEGVFYSNTTYKWAKVKTYTKSYNDYGYPNAGSGYKNHATGYGSQGASQARIGFTSQEESRPEDRFDRAAKVALEQRYGDITRNGGWDVNRRSRETSILTSKAGMYWGEASRFIEAFIKSYNTSPSITCEDSKEKNGASCAVVITKAANAGTQTWE